MRRGLLQRVHVVNEAYMKSGSAPGNRSQSEHDPTNQGIYRTLSA